MSASARHLLDLQATVGNRGTAQLLAAQRITQVAEDLPGRVAGTAGNHGAGTPRRADLATRSRLMLGPHGSLGKTAAQRNLASAARVRTADLTAPLSRNGHPVQRDVVMRSNDEDAASLSAAGADLDASMAGIATVEAAIAGVTNGVNALGESQTLFAAQCVTFNEALAVHKAELAGIGRELELQLTVLKMIVDGLMAATPLAQAQTQVASAVSGLLVPAELSVFGKTLSINLSGVAGPVQKQAQGAAPGAGAVGQAVGGPGVPGAAAPPGWTSETAFYQQLASASMEAAKLLRLTTPIADAKAAGAVGKERVEQLRKQQTGPQSPSELATDALALKLLTERLTAKVEAIHAVAAACVQVRDTVAAVKPSKADAEREIWTAWVAHIPHELIKGSLLANKKLQALLKRKGVWELLAVTELPGYLDPHDQQLTIFMAEAVSKVAGARGQVIDELEVDGTLPYKRIPIDANLPPLRTELTEPRTKWKGPAVIVGGVGLRQLDFTFKDINDKTALFAKIYGEGYVGMRLRPLTPDRSPDELDKAMGSPPGT